MAKSGLTRQERGAEAYEVQCEDCFRIFASDVPPREATCESCGSSAVVKW